MRILKTACGNTHEAFIESRLSDGVNIIFSNDNNKGKKRSLRHSISGSHFIRHTQKLQPKSLGLLIGRSTSRHDKSLLQSMHPSQITICEKLMWAAMNGTIMKFLATELPECDMQSLKTKFKNQYRKIRSEVDDIGPITKNPLRICLTGGVIWLAAYEACEGKMDEEMFSRMITDTMQSPLFQKAFGAKDPFVSEKQQKKVVAFQTANGISDSEHNWYTDYTPGIDETEYFCTYRKCGLCTLGRKYGHPELIPYMCQMDYISIDMMGAILYRTQTLATGGDCCDFHVVKKGSKWEA